MYAGYFLNSLVFFYDMFNGNVLLCVTNFAELSMNLETIRLLAA